MTKTLWYGTNPSCMRFINNVTAKGHIPELPEETIDTYGRIVKEVPHDTVFCTGIELTLQIQSHMTTKATLKEFKEKLAGDERFQSAIAALREDVENFASNFSLPGLPDF